jgi:hypothetical protein
MVQPHNRKLFQAPQRAIHSSLLSHSIHAGKRPEAMNFEARMTKQAFNVGKTDIHPTDAIRTAPLPAAELTANRAALLQLQLVEGDC